MNTQNITHYYLDFGYSTATKNKLQNEAHDYIKSLKGKLFVVGDFENVKKQIINTIELLNVQNPRCKPLKVHFWDDRLSGALMLSGFHSVQFHIRPAELSHLSSLTYQPINQQ